MRTGTSPVPTGWSIIGGRIEGSCRQNPYGRGLSPSENAHPIRSLADRDEPCPYDMVPYRCVNFETINILPSPGSDTDSQYFYDTNTNKPDFHLAAKRLRSHFRIQCRWGTHDLLYLWLSFAFKNRPGYMDCFKDHQGDCLQKNKSLPWNPALGHVFICNLLAF